MEPTDILLDFVIKGATVIDGTGSKGEVKDVGVFADRIVEMAPNIETEAADCLKSDGLVLSPGFIDVHSHDDFHVLIEPEVHHNVLQGVTTVVVGNCGFGAAASDDGKSQMKAINEPSSDLPDWDGYAGYLDEVDKTAPVLNVAALVGHHTARLQAMGGVANRPPSEFEMDVMVANVEEGMQAGAIGISTGLVYEPGRYASTDEVADLAKVAGRYGGIYVSHMRDEGSALLDSVEETLRKELPNIKVVKHISHGLQLDEYRKTVEKHKADLVVLQAHDPDQQAMNATAYSLAVELRTTPLLIV